MLSTGRLSRAGLALLFTSVIVNPASVASAAACDMDVTDNTFRRGLDINDMSDEVRANIRTVEQYHFTADVAALRKGITTELPGDIEYTLRYIPNHYAALMSYAKWELEHPGAAASQPRSIDCYFQRAVGFQPSDTRLHALYGVVLHRARRYSEARKEYQAAEEMGLESAELFYNRGLLELDTGNVDVARAYAEKAYALGYPLPGLRTRLKRAGAAAQQP